jgi:hypothetical protein
MDDGKQKASLLQVVRAVLSAFLGIRRKGEHESIKVTPLQLIVTGIIAAALFVASLVTIVRLVTR